MTSDLPNFSAAEQIVRHATGSAFPAAVVEVGGIEGPVWQQAFGRTHEEIEAPPATLQTVFDLASLTKVIATTTLAMGAVDSHRLSLTDLVANRLSEWRGPDRATVTIEDLLAHQSGLTAHLPFFRDHEGRREFERAICTLPLEYPPRSKSVYSDLGFILLGFILEDASTRPLDAQLDMLATQHRWGKIQFRPSRSQRLRIAPTEVDPWRGRLLVGEVHDENTWALGGVAGHAGLFGTADAVGRFARSVLGQYRGDAIFAHGETFDRFITRSSVPGSTRALGWDTMRTTSSCGALMSPRAIGHTGFTGTSLWIDPVPGVYVVFLTNRVSPSRENDQILGIRPRFHDAVMTAIHSVS